MPLSPELLISVDEALVMQSSGRLAPQPGGRLAGGLRFGVVALEAELAATGGSVATDSRAWTGVTLRPALLVDVELRRGPFAAALAVGPGVALTWTRWEGFDPWWAVAPGARVRADCRWDVADTLALELGLGAMVRAGGPDLELGLGLRWAP